MVSHTNKICERYTHIYGSDGEIYADSTTITVEDFNTGGKKVYEPKITDVKSGHGGGDEGLVRQFVGAVNSVMNEGAEVEVAQREWVGCSCKFSPSSSPALLSSPLAVIPSIPRSKLI